MGKCQDLLDAARSGNFITVNKLLEQNVKRGGPLSSFRRGLSINGQDINGYTALHHSCLNGHVDIVRLLLAHGAMADVPDIRGSTPLYLASWAGHEDIVKLLLTHPGKPANPNAQTIENETPLHCAAQHGHNAVLSILLAHDADPTIRNNSFQTALDLAAQFGRLEAVKTLIRTHPELIEPFRAYDEMVSFESGSSPPYTITPTKHIFTHSCLHLASRNGHKKVVETLLEAGVDVNIVTHAGTALHEAALCGKKSVVYTLLQAGIDPRAVDGNGRTVLDVLKDYPQHVTYEIVSIINDFCNKNANDAVCPPANDINANRNDNVTVEKSANSPPLPQSSTKIIAQSSVEQSKKPPEAYTQMEPVKWQTSNNKTSLGRVAPIPPLQNAALAVNKGSVKDSKQLLRQRRVENCAQYHCVDEYVEMSEPNTCSACPCPPHPPPSSLQQPSSNTSNAELGDYVNIHIVTTQKTTPQTNDNTNGTFSAGPRCLDDNNNTTNRNRLHSPTPDFPPPSVSEAENTIFEIVRPLGDRKKRRSLRAERHDETRFYDGLKSFIWENNLEPEEPEPTSLSSSRVSECVEEFIGDVPFAGLFKGSSLNLANEAMESRRSSPIENRPNSRRSPSLFNSVPSITKSTKRPVPISGPNGRCTTSTTNDEFDVAKVWDEINTIFESIGKQVRTKDTKLGNIGELAAQAPMTDTLRKKTLNIRKPSELLLGASNETANPNWCHSANILVYGYVLYNVFYLGSTVIRELHGTASTRKSIQKLKREETPQPQELSEDGLLEDCNSSTRILKATNQQTRREVSIALSHSGVRFIDIESKNTISVHDIENINCVCQDSDDLRYFAYITREGNTHYCHVFMVDSLELATEIILTLGQAFEVAYQLALAGKASSSMATEKNNGPSYIDVVDNI